MSSDLPIFPCQAPLWFSAPCSKRWWVLALGLTLMAALWLPAQTAAAAETWVRADPLNGTRELHTATLLPNGKVLVAGGCL